MHKKITAPLDKLLASEVVLSYGIDVEMLHVPGQNNVAFRVVVPNYDAQKKKSDKLVADGVIYAYELDTEAVHTTAPGAVWTFVTMPNLAAKDKVNAAFEEAEKMLPEAERNMLDKLYYDIVDSAAHRDSLAVREVYKTK